MFHKVRENAALAIDGLFGRDFDFFDLLDQMGKLPTDLDRFVDYDLVVRPQAPKAIPGELPRAA